MRILPLHNSYICASIIIILKFKFMQIPQNNVPNLETDEDIDAKLRANKVKRVLYLLAIALFIVGGNIAVFISISAATLAATSSQFYIPPLIGGLVGTLISIVIGGICLSKYRALKREHVTLTFKKTILEKEKRKLNFISFLTQNQGNPNQTIKIGRDGAKTLAETALHDNDIKASDLLQKLEKYSALNGEEKNHTDHALNQLARYLTTNPSQNVTFAQIKDTLIKLAQEEVEEERANQNNNLEHPPEVIDEIPDEGNIQQPVPQQPVPQLQMNNLQPDVLSNFEEVLHEEDATSEIDANINVPAIPIKESKFTQQSHTMYLTNQFS